MRSAWIRVLVLGMLAVIATTGVLPAAVPVRAADAAGPIAVFNWEMPERTGLDEDGDGVIDVMTRRSDIDPPGWEVTLDACDSEPVAGAVHPLLFYWSIDRYPITDPDDQQTPCERTYTFPHEGSYEVTLDVVSDGQTATIVRDILVQDFLIVALGDSFASGQGNPDLPIPSSLLQAANDAFEDLTRQIEALAAMEISYGATSARIETARNRLDDLYLAARNAIRVCDPFSPYADAEACLGAPAAVAAAVENLGAALMGVGETFYQQTLQHLDAIATAVLTISETALEEAKQLMRTALDDLDQILRDAIADQAITIGTAREALRRALDTLAPTWQDQRCNRSAISGQARAALALERADPHTSVTLVHLACSGATVAEGLIGPYAGVEVPEGAADLPPQVDRAAALISGREVDALLLSIGGNDVGFGPMIVACMIGQPCSALNAPAEPGIADQIGITCATAAALGGDCTADFEDLIADYVDTRSAASIFAQGSALLPSRYAALAERLALAFPAIAAEPGRVLIAEYPNAVEDDDGSACDAGSDGLTRMLPGITADESTWFRDQVTQGLDALVADAAGEHGWTLVDGIYDAFHGHGYCAEHGWMRRMQDAFTMQGTKEGAVHPTREGQGVYRDRYLAALEAALYADDGTGLPDLARPRRPVRAYAPNQDITPPVVTGVPDQLPNAAGWYRADVIIDWVATDPAPSSGTPTDPANTMASIEGALVRYTSGSSCDPAGRCATGSMEISMDRTSPAVACTTGTAVFQLGQPGAVVTGTVTDGLSGPVAPGVSAPADTSFVGTRSVALSGEDLAGNTATAACAYRVEFVMSSFGAPVDGGGVLNVAKAGRAIPLRWQLTDAAGNPFDGLATASISVQGLSCSAGSTTDLVEETLAGASGLQSLGDGTYQLNWKSPSSYAGSCKQLRLDLGEGIVHTALFKFSK